MSAPRCLSARTRRRSRAPTALVVPGVGAFPRAMERLRALGLDRFLLERAERRASRCSGICLGMQLAFDRSDRAGRRERPRDRARRRSARWRPPALKLPQIGWNEVRWERRAAVLAGLGGQRRLLPRAQLRRRPRRSRRRARHRRVRRALRLASSPAGRSSASSSTPRSPRTTGWRCSPTGSSPRATPARDPLPGDRHPRRARRAARPGGLRPADGVRGDPLDAARCVGGGRRAAPARRRPRRRARRERRSTSTHVARIARADGPAAAARGGLRSRAAIAAAFAAGAQRVVLGTAAFADEALARRRARRARRARRRLGRRARRAWSPPPAGRETGDARRRGGGRRRWRRAACAASSTPTSIATACSGGLDIAAIAAWPTRCTGELLYSGGIGSLGGPARRSSRCATRGWPA